MPKARIVVAGAGLIGQAHIERILREPEASLAGIVDKRPEAGARAAALGVPFSGNLPALLASERPDGVVIALPNQSHWEAGLAAVEARVAVLMEKPVCETVEQALELAAAADAAGVPVLVGHHRRHSVILQRAAAVIASGRLGRVTAVNALCLLLKPPDYFEGAFAWRRQPGGGGPVLINLIHTIDDLRLLCGEIATVQALVSNQARGFAVEDTAGVLVGFRSGAIGTIALSDIAAGPWSWELTSGENPAYSRTAENSYAIAGSHGSLAVPRLTFWHHGGEAGHWWTPVESEDLGIPPRDPLTAQMRHFCDVARRTAPPLIDARNAAETLRATLAVHEAARTGHVVRL